MKKKILFIFLFVLSLMCLCACGPLEELYITQIKEINICVGDEYNFAAAYFESSDDNIFKIEDKTGYGVSEGRAFVTSINSGDIILIVNVKEEASYITLNGESYIKEGESFQITSVVSPISVNQDVTYSSSDENVLKVSETGLVTGVGEGFATIIVSSKEFPNIKSELNVIVQNEDEIFYDPIVRTEYIDGGITNLNASDLNGLVNALVMNVKNVVVGVEKYISAQGIDKYSEFGSGIIYKRNAVLTDGTIVNDVDYTYQENTIKEFEYYIITTRYLTKNSSKILVKIAEDVDKVDGTLIQYDDKIDLAVIKIRTKLYLSTAKFGNSDSIKQGEFVISVGNGSGEEYFRSSTFGIISYTKRYISTDTDDDDTSDWDSEYIQHDSTINSGDNGGALINMKGELIGINDTKILSKSDGINGISFAIPINLAQEIVSKLEVGEKPERPILGVTIIDVRSYYKNIDYYNAYEPSTKDIPLGLEYGFYITQVNEGGVAEMAHVLVGDIILEFNGATTKYSYLLRSELGKFIIGSGQTAELKVLRNGEEITLTVTF